MPRLTRSSRKLEVLTVHMHFGKKSSAAVNYKRLFQAISETRGDQRAVSISGKSVALPEFRLDEIIVKFSKFKEGLRTLICRKQKTLLRFCRAIWADAHFVKRFLCRHQ